LGVVILGVNFVHSRGRGLCGTYCILHTAYCILMMWMGNVMIKDGMMTICMIGCRGVIRLGYLPSTGGRMGSIALSDNRIVNICRTSENCKPQHHFMLKITPVVINMPDRSFALSFASMRLRVYASTPPLRSWHEAVISPSWSAVLSPLSCELHRAPCSPQLHMHSEYFEMQEARTCMS
jgi:hypothetical protein